MPFSPEMQKIERSIRARSKHTVNDDELAYDIYGISVKLRGTNHHYPNTVSFHLHGNYLRFELQPGKKLLVKQDEGLFGEEQMPNTVVTYDQLLAALTPEYLLKWHGTKQLPFDTLRSVIEGVFRPLMAPY